MPKVKRNCQNPNCQKEFICERWQKTQYCTRTCAFEDPALRKRMSIAHIGHSPSEETRVKLRKLKHTDESKEKIRQASLNRNFSEEQKKVIGEKITKAKLGHSVSKETREKLRIFREGKTFEDILGVEGAKIAKEKQRTKMIGISKSKEYLENWVKSRKKNGWFKDPIATGLKIGLKNKGKGPYKNKTPEQIQAIVEKTKETKRLNPQLIKGGRTKYYDTSIGQVQGTYELNYINNLIKENKDLPIKPQGVKTPFGNYHPDFEFKDRYIEIKSTYTYKIYLGQARPFGRGELNTIQKQKLEWVSANIKPVEIIVLDKNGNIIAKAL